jgi:cation diffusion facilitator family transporter
MDEALKNKKKYKIAMSSMFAAIFIVAIKFIATYLSGSLGVMSELFHSSIDLVATIATIISVKYSSKPPDEMHNYGHEKIESFSALFQVIILVAMCAYLIYESIERIINHVQVHISIFTFSVILICIFIDFSRSRALMKVAKETKSQALEADSLHFSSDIMSSIVVLIGMVFTYFNLFALADPISAMAVSVIIVITTFRLTKRAFDSLMDRVPQGLREKISKEISSMEGVEGIKNFRIRSSGSKVFIDMIILIARTKMFSTTHDIMDSVEKRIMELAPDSDIVIHSEPIETRDETINDKIRMIVNKEGFKCHDIFSHKIESDIFSELHVEISDTNDLSLAHKRISKLEDIIKKEIPVITKVNIHLDEPSELLFETIDITSKSRELIRHVEKILNEKDYIKKFYDIKVISSNDKLRVSLICEFEEGLTFEEVHEKVTILESKIYLYIKELYPNLSNVIIHAEPINSNQK